MKIQSSISEVVVLLQRVAEGDKVAFHQLYQATSAKLFGIILRILKKRSLSEEVLQDVYVRIWQNAAGFEPGKASPITWMAAIARNRAIDVARRAQPVSGDTGMEIEQIADQQPSADVRLEKQDEMDLLEKCLEELDGNRSAIVRLAYLEGLSRQDLADRFGQPVSTIKTWLRRSLLQLRDCLGS